MWGIKIISGLQTGQVHQLKDGDYTVGRHETCDIAVSHPGISRKHFKITVKEGIAILKDLNSVNGTFVNGVLVKRTVLNAGDKISCNNMIFEFHRMDYLKSLPSVSNTPHQQQTPPTSQSFAPPENMTDIHGNLAIQSQQPLPTLATSDTNEAHSIAETANTSFFTNVQNYFETVVMPGIYQLAKWAEFKWILGGFILVYVLLITLLSVFPLIQISEERILKESQLRAVEIAKSLAQRYRAAINSGLSSTFVVREERLEGVNVALIIAANDGHVLAPARKLGSHVDVPFIHHAREKDILSIEQLQNNTIGVSIPIRTIDPETGESRIKAFSVLLYKASVLKFEDIIRLFIQVLAFALMIGFVLFILFYRLIEYPIRQLNIQIDEALKKGDSEVSIDFNYPEIQKLSTNINSALSRITHNNENAGPATAQISSEEEAQSLIQVIKTAGLILDTEGSIIAINPECDQLIGDHGTMLHRNINDISDQALQLNLQDLFQQANTQYGQAVTNELEFAGVNYTIEAVCILDTQTPKFIIVTFSSQEAGGDF